MLLADLPPPVFPLCLSWALLASRLVSETATTDASAPPASSPGYPPSPSVAASRGRSARPPPIALAGSGGGSDGGGCGGCGGGGGGGGISAPSIPSMLLSLVVLLFVMVSLIEANQHYTLDSYSVA